MKKIRNTRAHIEISCGLLTVTAMVPAAQADVTATNSAVIPAPLSMWQKPAWLTDFSLGLRESYDDNILLVSGNGLQPHGSWIAGISPKIGFNFAPLLDVDSPYKALTFVYAPDINIYHDAPEESYDAQRFMDSIKLAEDNFSLGITNSFLYNNGSRTAPTYAESEAPGGNTLDRFRNFFAFAAPRERRDQIQDRSTVMMQYDSGKTFIRPVASLLYYDLRTVFHNTGAAPYIGYQNWPDRYDANGGADWGYRLTPSLAVTIGYRYGHQYQQQFPSSITSDFHYSSNDYQRALFGLEGSPWSWLTFKAQAGPDFRNYNSNAGVDNYHPIFVYAEGSATATLTANQSLSFYTKEWEWVSSAGFVPYYDSTYALTYHWNATRRLGLDLGGKILNADFHSGHDLAGLEPSVRNDIEYAISVGVNYAFTPHLSASLAYNYTLGRNLLKNLSPTLGPAYRDFDDDLATLGVQYKF
jgi:opacity protein-like surface antigen